MRQQRWCSSETKMDHIHSKITFRFQANSTISTISTLNFSFSAYEANNALGNNLLFNPQTYSIVVDPLATSIVNVNNTIPEINIYPNPYSSSTQIFYVLNSKSDVVVEVYNVIGNKVETFVNCSQLAGEYKYNFSAKEKGFDAGVYFVKITIDGKETIRKIVEMK